MTKSPMVTNSSYITNKGNYTDLKVLRSGAGYYVGTMYEERDASGKITFQEPGSRDSDYFATEAEAAGFLKAIEGTDDDTAAIILRNHP